MCIKWFKKKSNIANDDKKIKINGSFNFEKYPQLFFEYLNYSNAVSKVYKFSVMDGDGLDVANKFENADKEKESKENVFAKTIYEIFNPLKPTLENADKDFEKENWDDIFKNKNFNELNNKEKSILIGLIECNYIYVLPKEYYLKGKERTFEYSQLISLNKMKQLLENENK